MKVQALENYISETAWHRGELQRALYWLDEADKVLRDQWDDLEGWLPLAQARKTGKEVTQEDIRQAKRQVDRALYEALRETRHLKEHLGAQIRRLEKDYEAASRVYTLLTGA
jgi:hypothetical protein